MSTIPFNLKRLKQARNAINFGLRSKKKSINAADGFDDFATDINGLTQASLNITMDCRAKPELKYITSQRHWTAKTWSGLTNFNGYDVWSDGTNIYYSAGTTQYVLNTSNSTWSAKTWTGLTNFYGRHIWTDGFDLYYSSGTNHYKLKKDKTWVAKSWNGLNSFNGEDIWSLNGGIYIYYSNGTTQYSLNRETETWTTKTWTGLTNFYGRYLFFVPPYLFYLSGTTIYYCNNETWTTAFSTTASMYGYDAWGHDDNIYISTGSNHCQIMGGGTAVITFTGLTNFNGHDVWTDGINTYYSNGTNQYQYSPIIQEPIATSVRLR